MTVEREGCDDPKVPATAAERPVQIGVRVGVGGREQTIGEDNLG